MSVFRSPHLWVWRQGCWQRIHRKESLKNRLCSHRFAPSAIPNVSLEEALMALATHVKADRSPPSSVLLPNHWLEKAAFDLDEALPTSLYWMAAHTHASNVTQHDDASHVLSYWVQKKAPHRLCMQVAMLRQADHHAFQKMGIKHVFSEDWVMAAQASSWRKLCRTVRPFSAYQADYLEQSAERSLQAKLSVCLGLVAAIGVLASVAIHQQTPDQFEYFDWPWPRESHQASAVMGGLTQLRTLPLSVRLDHAFINQETAQLDVTGADQTVHRWQTHWPDSAPVLEITVERGR